MSFSHWTNRVVEMRLVSEPDTHPGAHEMVERVYPGLEGPRGPAVFVDCYTCGLTWEVGK